MNTIFRHCERSAAIHLFRHFREYGNPKTSDNIFIIPIGFAAGSFNLYGYVVNDPVNFVDPEGLDRWEVDTASNTTYLYLPGSDYPIASWPTVSGPYGRGTLPNGSYIPKGKPNTVYPDPNRPNWHLSYCDPSGNCWWLPITPLFDTDRTGLGFHPDGNVPGTAGCVGATDSNTRSMRDALRDHRGIIIVK
jgi:uncharacterized protein RhaS with RHS repeats